MRILDSDCCCTTHCCCTTPAPTIRFDILAFREALMQQQATVERQYRLVEGEGYKVMIPCA